MRVTYAPDAAPSDASPETQEIYNRIAERRQPRPLIPLDLTLLQAPPVADGWNSFLGSIRNRTTITKSMLELAISRVAVLNGAVHEWDVHGRLALGWGISKQGLEACRTAGEYEDDDEKAKSKGWYTEVLTKYAWAVLAYTDEMTRKIKVSDKVFGVLRTCYSEREIVELTAAIGAYNCVSRFLVALDVGECNEKEMKSVDELLKDLEDEVKANGN